MNRDLSELTLVILNGIRDEMLSRLSGKQIYLSRYSPYEGAYYLLMHGFGGIDRYAEIHVDHEPATITIAVRHVTETLDGFYQFALGDPELLEQVYSILDLVATVLLGTGQ